MLKFTFVLITKLCKKEVTWCSLSLSLNHLSSLRYSRRDARAARSMTNTNGEPFNSIDNAYRKNKTDKLNKMTQPFKGWSLRLKDKFKLLIDNNGVIERAFSTIVLRELLWYQCVAAYKISEALKQEALFFSKVKKWRHYLAKIICKSFQEN